MELLFSNIWGTPKASLCTEHRGQLCRQEYLQSCVLREAAVNLCPQDVGLGMTQPLASQYHAKSSCAFLSNAMEDALRKHSDSKRCSHVSTLWVLSF